jgi:hypothetical protein
MVRTAPGRNREFVKYGNSVLGQDVLSDSYIPPHIKIVHFVDQECGNGDENGEENERLHRAPGGCAGSPNVLMRVRCIHG